MNNFEKAMPFIADHEWGNRKDGGLTRDPVDPGGVTKYGISQRANPDVDVANLTLENAFKLYRARYWDAYNLDSQPWPFAVAVFDSYIQHNPKVVKEWVEDSNGDIRIFMGLRRVYYLSIIKKNPSQERFRKGWLNRLNDLQKFYDINLA